jgi:hypothetical protein
VGLSEAEVVLRFATSSRDWALRREEEEPEAVLIGRGMGVWASARRRSSPSRLRSFAAPAKGFCVDPIHGIEVGTGASARVND